MKKLAGLLIMVTVLSGVMVGCSSEPTYTQVAVGAMTVSIPDDWQRPDDYEEILGSVLTEDTEGWIEADVYKSKGKDALIFIELVDMFSYYESQYWSWQGWDITLGEYDMTKEDYVEGYIQSGLMAGAVAVTPLARQQLTISGYESWELSFTVDDGEDIRHMSVVVVFAPDNLGIVQVMLGEDDWAKFEATWTAVRDSIVI